jgi:hypothetical protein
MPGSNQCLDFPQSPAGRGRLKCSADIRHNLLRGAAGALGLGGWPTGARKWRHGLTRNHRQYVAARRYPITMRSRSTVTTGTALSSRLDAGLRFVQRESHPRHHTSRPIQRLCRMTAAGRHVRKAYRPIRMATSCASQRTIRPTTSHCNGATWLSKTGQEIDSSTLSPWASG